MEVVIYVLLALLAFAAGAGATYYMLQQRSSAQFRRAKDESDRLLAEAENQRREQVTLADCGAWRRAATGHVSPRRHRARQVQRSNGRRDAAR